MLFSVLHKLEKLSEPSQTYKFSCSLLYFIYLLLYACVRRTLYTHIYKQILNFYSIFYANIIHANGSAFPFNSVCHSLRHVSIQIKILNLACIHTPHRRYRRSKIHNYNFIHWFICSLTTKTCVGAYHPPQISPLFLELLNLPSPPSGKLENCFGNWVIHESTLKM